jgi:hypothetical protein
MNELKAALAIVIIFITGLLMLAVVIEQPTETLIVLVRVTAAIALLTWASTTIKRWHYNHYILPKKQERQRVFEQTLREKSALKGIHYTEEEWDYIMGRTRIRPASFDLKEFPMKGTNEEPTA